MSDSDNDSLANPYASPRSSLELAQTRTDPDTLRRVACVWIAAAAGVALAIGAAARWARPLFAGPVHYEALAALGLLALLMLTLQTRFWLFPKNEGFAYLQVGLAAIWVSFCIGWSVLHAGFWDEMVAVCVTCWIASAVVALLIWLLRSIQFDRWW